MAARAHVTACTACHATGAGAGRTGRGGVADLVLAADDGAVGQLGAERDALLGADGRQHEGALRDARNAREQEDGRLQRAEEQARAREEEVACAARPSSRANPDPARVPLLHCTLASRLLPC